MTRLSIQRALPPAGLAVFAMVVAGCATEPSRLERQFGTSVQQTIDSQKLHRTKTVAGPVKGMDGDRAVNVLNAYREDITKPAGAPSNITINVGR